MDKRVIIVAGVAGAGLLGYYLLSKGETFQGLMGSEAAPGWSGENAVPTVYQFPAEPTVNFPQPQPLAPYEEIFPMDDISNLLADTKKVADPYVNAAPASNEAKKATSIGNTGLDAVFGGILSGLFGPQLGEKAYGGLVETGQYLGKKTQSAVSTSASNWLAGKNDSLLAGLRAVITGFVPGGSIALPIAEQGLRTLSPVKKSSTLSGPAMATEPVAVASAPVAYVNIGVGQFGEPVYKKSSGGGGHNSSTYTPSSAASKAVAASVSKFGGTVTHTVKTGTASVSYWSTKK